MDLKQYEHLAPEGATHLFTDTTWNKNQVYAYLPNNDMEAYHISTKMSYPYSNAQMDILRECKTSVIWEIPPLNLENV